MLLNGFSTVTEIETNEILGEKKKKASDEDTDEDAEDEEEETEEETEDADDTEE